MRCPKDVHDDAKKRARKHTPEFKARAVKLVLEEGKSRAQVAKDLELTRSGMRAG